MAMRLTTLLLPTLSLFRATDLLCAADGNLSPNFEWENKASKKLYHAIFDDNMWNTAQEVMKNRRRRNPPQRQRKGEIPEAPSYDEDASIDGGTIDVPPQPRMPEKFAFTGIFTRAFQGESIYDNQPLVYTFALDGNDGSVTGDDMTLYFQLDDFACTANETESRSFMVGDFQYFDGMSDTPVPTEFCWAAPPGEIIYEGYPSKYKSLLQTWLIGDFFGIPWQYGGKAPSVFGPVHLWIRDTLSEAVSGSTASSTVLANLVEDGSIIYYQTRIDADNTVGAQVDFFDSVLDYATATVKIDIFEFQTYSEDEDVLNAQLPYAVEDCDVMQPGANTAQCLAGNVSATAAQDLFVQSLNARGTGYDPSFPTSYPMTNISYEMVGDQDMVMSLPWFVPPMNNRSYNPVRNQGSCGSCYSFSASEVISSSLNQANPGNTFVFSNQHIMNCLPLWEQTDSEGNLVVALDVGVGCWGGNAGFAIDWLVATGSKMPLITEVPYIGFSGTCNMSVPMYDTGITGRSTLTSVDEMKNALYYRGDVAILLPVDGGWYNDFTSQVSFPYYLGVGLSGPVVSPPAHAINVIGWGPCLVPLGTDEYPCGIPGISPNVIGECWIVQNSWGTEYGYNGYLFINNDPNCDTGVLTFGPMIPLRD